MYSMMFHLLSFQCFTSAKNTLAGLRIKQFLSSSAADHCSNHGFLSSLQALTSGPVRVMCVLLVLFVAMAYIMPTMHGMQGQYCLGQGDVRCVSLVNHLQQRQPPVAPDHYGFRSIAAITRRFQEAVGASPYHDHHHDKQQQGLLNTTTGASENISMDTAAAPPAPAPMPAVVSPEEVLPPPEAAHDGTSAPSGGALSTPDAESGAPAAGSAASGISNESGEVQPSPVNATAEDQLHTHAVEAPIGAEAGSAEEGTGEPPVPVAEAPVADAAIASTLAHNLSTFAPAQDKAGPITDSPPLLPEEHVQPEQHSPTVDAEQPIEPEAAAAQRKQQQGLDNVVEHAHEHVDTDQVPREQPLQEAAPEVRPQPEAVNSSLGDFEAGHQQPVEPEVEPPAAPVPEAAAPVLQAPEPPPQQQQPLHSPTVDAKHPVKVEVPEQQEQQQPLGDVVEHANEHVDTDHVLRVQPGPPQPDTVTVKPPSVIFMHKLLTSYPGPEALIICGCAALTMVVLVAALQVRKVRSAAVTAQEEDDDEFEPPVSIFTFKCCLL